jgi:hypothetical protein
MKDRLVSPNMVALTPDAVASSAAMPMITKPTCPIAARPTPNIPPTPIAVALAVVI